MRTILLAPHNDDEQLFASYTIQREKPLVIICTDSFIQPNRGDIGCSAEERRAESQKAAELLGYEVVFLGIRDTQLTEENLIEALQLYGDAEKVYAPTIQGGNHQHDLVGKVAKETFRNCVQYTTYTKTELWTKGEIEVIPSEEEKNKKIQALNCYQSQINLASTRPHFLAVIEKSEWLI